VDCIEGMNNLLNPSMIDVIVTSPPYNIGKKYNSYQDNKPDEKYLNWLHHFGMACSRVLKENGSFFLNIGYKPTKPWLPLEVAFQFRDLFQLQNIMIWVKSITIESNDRSIKKGKEDAISIGHFKPIGGKRFLNDNFEYVFHFTKTGNVPLDRLAIGVPYQDKSNIQRWKGAKGGKRCRGNTWFVPYDTIQSSEKSRPHPSSFPKKLPKLCIKLHGTERVNLVMDPFMGIGTTALACKELGVNFIGFEIDPTYAEFARLQITKTSQRE